MEETDSVTKLEWVTCTACGTTFQVAVPIETKRMRVSIGRPWNIITKYSFPVCCANPDCRIEFWVMTDVSAVI